MELYIEKKFLDNFYLDYENRIVQKTVESIMLEYGSKQVFMDVKIDTAEDLELLKKENNFFALICSNDKVPVPVTSMKDHIFQASGFGQTLIFLNTEQDWCKEAESKGALCFYFDNYQEKIKKITKKLHFKIDLSENFTGWDFLHNFKSINFNELVISDNYILSDTTNQKIDDNIIPILKNLIFDEQRNIQISILTKKLVPINQEDKYKKEKAKKLHGKLNRIFANFKTKFSIILSDFSSDFKLHDRNIATNFSLIDCGEGFNLMPYKASNSQIVSESIFEKYTYNRLKNIRKNQKEYIEKLIKSETIQFKMFPEK